MNRYLIAVVLSCALAYSQIPSSSGGVGGGGGAANYRTPAISGTGTTLAIPMSAHANSHPGLITECYTSAGVAMIKSASPAAGQFNYTVAQVSPFDVAVTFGSGGNSGGYCTVNGSGQGLPGVSGSTGPTGSTGPAATVAVGTVATGAAGSPAAVTNAGTSGAAILNFSIPQGAVGPAGATGATGPAGATGPPGSGSGDVVGPSSSSANRVPIFGTTTGKALIQSPLTVDPTTGELSSNSTARGCVVLPMDSSGGGTRYTITLCAPAALSANVEYLIGSAGPPTALSLAMWSAPVSGVSSQSFLIPTDDFCTTGGSFSICSTSIPRKFSGTGAPAVSCFVGDLYTDTASVIGYYCSSTDVWTAVANSTHPHAASDITSGTLALARGGTNQTTWTAGRCVQVKSDGTTLESAAGACGSGGSIASTALVLKGNGSGAAVAATSGTDYLAPDGSGNVVITGRLSVGSGTVAGRRDLLELAANAEGGYTKYRRMLAPDALTQTWHWKFLDAIPTARIVLGLATPTTVTDEDGNTAAKASDFVHLVLSGIGTTVVSTTGTQTNGAAVVIDSNGDHVPSTLSGVVKMTSGVPSAVTGTSTNCVHVDGTSAACASGSSYYQNVTFDTTAMTQRGRLTLKPGTNVSFTPNDNSGGDASELTINATAGSGMSNPMTTAGDIIYGGTSGTPTRLAQPGNGTYSLTFSSGVPSYTAATGSTNCNDETVVCMFENFFPTTVSNGQIGALGWMHFGTGATPAQAAGEAKHWGVYSTTTATTAGGIASGFDLSGNGSVKGIPPINVETNWTAYYKFKTPSSLSEYQLYVGLRSSGSNITIPTSIGLWARYVNSTGCSTNATDTNWTFENNINNSGSATATASSLAPVASTWYTLRIKSSVAGTILYNIKADGGSWLGSDISISTNTPTVGMIPFFYQAICNTTARALLVDEFRLILTGIN